MAGLLNQLGQAFGGGGLLGQQGESATPQLRQAAGRQALWNAAASLLADSGRAGAGLGENLGRAMLAGQQGYQGAADRFADQRLRAAQLEQLKARTGLAQAQTTQAGQDTEMRGVIQSAIANAEGATPGEKLMNVGRMLSTQGYVDIGKKYYDQGQAMAGQSQPWKGQSIDAQSFNILQSADPGSQEYALAYNRATQPRYFQTADGSTYMLPGLDVSAFPQPSAPVAGGGGAGAGQQGGGAASTPGGQARGNAAPGSGGENMSAIPGAVRVSKGQPSQSERDAFGYYGRMEAAEKTLTDVLANYDPTGAGGKFSDIAEEIPGVGNYLVSGDWQLYRQAAMDWVRAKLRKESGAVISDAEFASEFETYFPQPGDSEKTIAQKAKSRRQAMEQLRASSGRAAENAGSPAPPATRPMEYLLDNRVITPNADGTGWVYKDTGEPVNED